MKTTNIKQKLEELGIPLSEIKLGDFDQIGEFTAKKNRTPGTEMYNKAGCYFRPNYERGILQHYLIKLHNVKSVLEIGHGRGYSTFCMARAMCEFGIDGKITTVDPSFDQNLLGHLQKVFPAQWFEKIKFISGTSEDFYAQCDERFDLIYIDGDHRYDYVKKDWEFAEQHFEKLVIFDDYHMPTKSQKDIECSRLIDEIDGYEKELLIMDRRIFFDDRRLEDDQIDYGQVILTKKEGK